MATTFTYIKDGVDPRLNIRIATDEAGFELVDNVGAIARYWGLSPNRIYFYEGDGVFENMDNGDCLARLERVTKEVAFDTSAH